MRCIVLGIRIPTPSSPKFRKLSLELQYFHEKYNTILLMAERIESSLKKVFEDQKIVNNIPISLKIIITVISLASGDVAITKNKYNYLIRKVSTLHNLPAIRLT